MTLDEFTDNYHKYISACIDEEGFAMCPLCARDKEGKLTISVLDLEPEQVYQYFWSVVTGTDKNIKDPEYVIVGIDRVAMPGQGTEFKDVLTCLCWWDDPAINWGKSLKVGVINYVYEPLIIRPWDWENAFWTPIVKSEAYHFIPPFRIKVERA